MSNGFCSHILSAFSLCLGMSLPIGDEQGMIYLEPERVHNSRAKHVDHCVDLEKSYLQSYGSAGSALQCHPSRLEENQTFLDRVGLALVANALRLDGNLVPQLRQPQHRIRRYGQVGMCPAHVRMEVPHFHAAHDDEEAVCEVHGVILEQFPQACLEPVRCVELTNGHVNHDFWRQECDQDPFSLVLEHGPSARVCWDIEVQSRVDAGNEGADA